MNCGEESCAGKILLLIGASLKYSLVNERLEEEVDPVRYGFHQPWRLRYIPQSVLANNESVELPEKKTMISMKTITCAWEQCMPARNSDCTVTSMEKGVDVVHYTTACKTHVPTSTKTLCNIGK
jgi:hypothetical protein